MESPHLYGNVYGEDKTFMKSEGISTQGAFSIYGSNFPNDEDSVTDLADLNTEEISIDLKNDFIKYLQKSLNGQNLFQVNSMLSSNPGVTQVSSNNSFYVGYLPEPVNQPATPDLSQLPVKQEPTEQASYTACSQQNSGIGLSSVHQNLNLGFRATQNGENSYSPPLNGQSQEISMFPGNKFKMIEKKSKNKVTERDSDEYKRRRERNNVAVRKSREKAKIRCKETEGMVKELQKQVEILTRENNTFRSMFSSAEGLPDHIRRELAAVRNFGNMCNQRH